MYCILYVIKSETSILQVIKFLKKCNNQTIRGYKNCRHYAVVNIYPRTPRALHSFALLIPSLPIRRQKELLIPG